MFLKHLDGSLDQMNQQFSQRAQKRIMNPPPVFGVSDTTEPKTWLYDPSIVSPQDYADQKGTIFAHKGERINPLERMPSYNKVLIFINGRRVMGEPPIREACLSREQPSPAPG